MKQVEAAGLGLELSSGLSCYLASHTTNSISKVSQITGIDFKTLKKISNGVVNLKKINPLKLAKLANLTSRKRDLIDFFLAFKSELDEKLVDIYLNIYRQVELKPIIPILETIEFEVYCLCGNSAGATLSQIHELSGLKAIDALEILLEKNLVVQIEDRYYTTSREFHFYERDNLKKHITEFSKKINLNKKSKLRNYLLYLHQSLNHKGIEELENLTVKYHQQVIKLFNDPFYKGQNHYYFFLGYDSNIDKDYSNNGRQS